MERNSLRTIANSFVKSIDLVTEGESGENREVDTAEWELALRIIEAGTPKSETKKTPDSRYELPDVY